jgi:eukaryotic-like serine/threonine-protein kinase
MSKSGAPPPGPPQAPDGRWQRLEELFAAASELADDERAAFLGRLGGDDAELRPELEGLLASSRGARDRLMSKVAAGAEGVANPRAVAQIGRTFGPYRLVKLLGEGGMGVVYLAERADGNFNRTVAIKILQHGYGSPLAIARFHDECRILAELKHPGIVHLEDEGHTDDGLPYLVLEWVDGVSIIEYARERGLKARARVELLLGVCAALQYAHGKLVVHRDIKPSNILVDRSGAPKLLDFGIAKLLDPGADRAREAHTRTGMAVLTPEYASPEQVLGRPLSVATDVYSLGGVLYELITGRPPQQPGDDRLEMQRLVCEVKPPLPSAVAPPELRREVKGDLDKIIENALRKDPAERYASVEQFADDLRRYLDGLPVKARTMTFGYLAGKFVRRNRGKLALALLVGGALSASTVVSVRQARRADAEALRAHERSDEVRRLANSLVFEIDEAIRDVAGTTGARELVVTSALKYLDRLAGQPDRDPALRGELALAYMKVGDIQGSPFDPNIGKPLEGLQSYQKAADLLAGLDAADPAVASARVRAMFGTGFMHHSNRNVEGTRSSLTEAIRRAREVPLGVEIDHTMVARAYLALAFDAKQNNNVVESDRYTDEGLAFVDTWDASTADARYWRAAFLLRRADSAARAGDPWGAADALRAVVDIHAALANEHPNTSKYRREKAYALLLLGNATGGVGDSRLWVVNTGDLAASADAFGKALAIFDSLAAEDPLNADAKMAIAIVRTSLGLLDAKRSPSDAVAEFARALEAYGDVPSKLRASPYGQENEFIAHCAMAHALAAQGQAEARARAEARAEAGLKLASGDPFNVAMCESLVARMALKLGDRAEALKRFESVRAALTPMADQPDTSALIGLVDTLQQLAALRPAEACSYHREALACWRSRPASTRYLREQAEELVDAAAKHCGEKR